MWFIKGEWGGKGKEKVQWKDKEGNERWMELKMRMDDVIIKNEWVVLNGLMVGLKGILG